MDLSFWLALEEEVAAAEINEQPVKLRFDANAKLGPQYIKNDPQEMSMNDRILAGVKERHALVALMAQNKKKYWNDHKRWKHQSKH